MPRPRQTLATRRARVRSWRGIPCRALSSALGDQLSEPTLFVCVTCRAGRELREGETPQGALLHAAVRDRLGHGTGVALREVSCLASCEHGCAAAIAAPGKWTNLLGHLSPALAADLLAYAGAYAASPTGTVMPSRRPASLGRLVLGRVPSLVTSVEIAA